MKDFAEHLSLSFDKRLAAQPILEKKRSQTERLLAALSWKARLDSDFPPIVCLVGGTGTGKSTLFNSLAECKVSEVGIRRPSTLQAVILVSENFADRLEGAPFLDRYGESRATVFKHDYPGLKDLVLVDTPDFDSVELSNRAIADDFFIISDILVFITSQEKYADLAGHEIQTRARQWGKKAIFVMNKVVSDTAYNDFKNLVHALGYETEPVEIERVEPSPALIPGLRSRPAFRALLTAASGTAGKTIREDELARLRGQALESLKDLANSIQSEAHRVSTVNSEISRILAGVEQAMEAQLDAIVSEDLEAQIRNRLQRLLRKYDVLFVPRMMVRHAIRSLFSAVAEIFLPRGLAPASPEDERDIRATDFGDTKAAVRLQPLEWAIARLNLAVAEMLSANPALDDLRQVARADVPRWSSEEIRARYEAAFPGMEHLLEAEFNRFRNGLSRTDELKLYGSYTLWALFLITAEIVVGGGISLLDALLNTVIVPFIPKWLLNLKVLDVLREIGERVDREHRSTLRGILQEQAELYKEEFSRIVPGDDVLEKLRSLEEGLARGDAVPNIR